jgi:mono/diheme cytochrome c family protein
MRTDQRRYGVIALGVFLGAVALLIGTAAQAQNLDQGKSAAALFANGCAACHKSPRGLARGRFKLQLYMFLQEHYATSSDQAGALASYLQAEEGPPRGQPRSGPRKPSHRHVEPNRDPAARPPAPVR